MMFSPKPKKAPTPTQLIKDAETRAAVRQIELQAQIVETELGHKLDQTKAAVVQAVKEKRSTEWTALVQRWTAVAVPFLPLVLVNTMAVFGQLGWGRHNLTQVGSSETDPARWAVALLFAATLESIALFLAYYANRALDRGDSATALYLGAFTVASIVAGVNYSHYASAEKVTPFGLLDVPGPSAMAVVFAMCSLASPWLWRIKHRDANRAKLHELGVIDSKAVRLSMARKLWHPIKSVQVMYHATWSGETNPAKAVEFYETRRQAKALKAASKPVKAPETAVEVVEVPKVQAATPAAVTASTAPALSPAPVMPEHLVQVMAKYPRAWEVLTDTHAANNPISQRKLAENYLGGNRHHAREVITAHTEWRLRNAHGASTATP